MEVRGRGFFFVDCLAGFERQPFIIENRQRTAAADHTQACLRVNTRVNEQISAAANYLPAGEEQNDGETGSISA